eukprot:TRINITY_DN81726_c0_g1_i1.p1 TRINITY_DN81726_c0_g1~~TRINITY_DN81726_c0_g1_i1.p1  ORF type:complete len:232 (-),score=31.86 TRINITY_DN81726_c0_g1_i1:53-718(-)
MADRRAFVACLAKSSCHRRAASQARSSCDMPCRGCRAGCRHCRSLGGSGRCHSAAQFGARGRCHSAGSRRSSPSTPASRKCEACGHSACSCRKRSISPLAWKQAQKRAEALAHSLLQWNCPTCKMQVEGFEDDPIVMVKVGHSGAPVSHAIEAQLSRRLARVFAEDQQRLQEKKEQQRKARNEEAYNAWVERKDLEQRLRAAVDQETEAEPLCQRQEDFWR